MQKFPIALEDLVPKESTFTLSTMPGATLTLCRWSLRVRSWATAKYTPQGVKEIFEKQKIEEIADMAYFMLKEKELLTTKEEFLEQICTVRDQVNVIKALLAAVGIGEPEIKKIDDALAKGEVAAPKPTPLTAKRIGAKSSIR